MAHRKLTDEEIALLESLADKSVKPEKEFEYTHVEKFIKKFSIQSGDTFYPKFVLYYLYYKYQKDRLMGKVKFFTRMNKYFETAIVSKQQGYYLKETLPLDTDVYFSARAYHRRSKKWRKRKKQGEVK